MQIHPMTMEYEALPSIIGLLESVAFMWVIVVITVGVFIWIAKKLWYVHSIPKHLAKDKGYSQAKLIFWLCIMGLVWKPLWVAAVILIVIDWDALSTYIRGLQK